jgi:hypothetical protein
MLYSLDWGHTDSLKKEKWLKTHQITSDQPFPGTLPENYSKWVNEMQFAIPQGLLEEIRHYSLRAEEEWGRKKLETKWEPIPTRGPAASYVLSAFTLVADCLYDPKTDNYSRDDKKILIPYILAYRFWNFQTKPDNLALYSGLNDLKANPLSNNFNDFIVNLELHMDLLREKKEKANKIIPNATLKDVLDNKRPYAFIKDITILSINLLKPKITRSNKGFILTAEFEGDPKKALNTMDTNQKITFSIKEENYTVVARFARILNIGGTPPPTITLEIDKLIVKEPDWIDDDTTSVKKISLNRIKEVRDEDLKANDDFNGIDMKPTFDADNSVCLRRKNHK